MKRIYLTIMMMAAFALFVSSSSHAFAQESNQKIATFNDERILMIIQALAGKRPVHNDAGVTNADTWAGQLDYSNPRAAMDEVLKNTKFEVRDQADGIHIQSRATERRAAPTRTLDTRERQIEYRLQQRPLAAQAMMEGLGSPIAVIEDLLKRYPGAIKADGTAGNFTQLDQLEQELDNLERAGRPIPRSVIQSAPVYRGTTRMSYSGQPSPAYYNDSQEGFFGPWYAEEWRRFVHRGNTVGLKTQGQTSGVEIYVRGCYIGNADQIDGVFNQKAPLIAGRAIELTAVRVSDDKSYTWTVRPESDSQGRAVGARHMTLVVSKKRLDQGRRFDRAAADRMCAASVR